jgi:NADPH:quinone reductase-like Zn-dependent oxidoreductase
MVTMKAVRIHDYGSADMLIYEDVPRPTPQAGEVLVRVCATSINPVDWKIREGRIGNKSTQKLPVILGMDLAGVVETVGPGVTTLQPGQEIYGVADTSRSGAYAEYAIASVDAIAPKPLSLSYTDAASVPVVAMTAWQALFEKCNLSAGQKVLIHAAAGGVGTFAIQLAKWKRAFTIGTTSAANMDFVSSLGADTVVDYKSTPFETVVEDIDVVFDPLGGTTRSRSWSVLKAGGTLVTIVGPFPPETPNQRVKAVGVGMHPSTSLLNEIAALLDTRQVRACVEQVFPLTEIRQAQALSQNGHARGKIAIEVAN